MALQEELEAQGNWLFRYRGTLPLIILIVGLAVFVVQKLHPDLNKLSYLSSTDWWVYLCLAVGLLGQIVRIYTVGHTPRNTSGRNIAKQIAETLNTTGMYSMVRHPLYVGNFLMWLGPAMLTANIWFVVSFVLFFWVYYERIMFAEEQFLRRKFGEAYLTWSNERPAFVPKLSAYKKSDLPFSWKKVIKKEKDGIAATFAIFASFNILGALLDNGDSFNMFLIGAAAVSLVYNLVIKIIKRKTSLLHEEGR